MKEKVYILEGSPIPLARARYTGRRVWDSQKHLKLVTGIALANQHGDHPLYAGPIHMEIDFFMPMPQDPRKRKKMDGNYHCYKPDIDNLIKFIADIANGILYNDDCIISSIISKKIYDEEPRTEITIREIDGPK